MQSLFFALQETALKRSGTGCLIISTCLLELRVEAIDFFALQETALKRSGRECLIISTCLPELRVKILNFYLTNTRRGYIILSKRI